MTPYRSAMLSQRYEAIVWRPMTAHAMKVLQGVPQLQTCHIPMATHPHINHDHKYMCPCQTHLKMKLKLRFHNFQNTAVIN